MPKLLKQIDILLNRSATALLQLRIDKEKFSDDNHDEKSFMQTCEGLDGILQVALAIQRTKLFNRIFEEPFSRAMEADLEYLETSTEDYTRFPGDPYYTRGAHPKLSLARNSIDALAFFTSVLCHLYEILKQRPSFRFGQYDRAFAKRCLDKCVKVIIENTAGEDERAAWPTYLRIEKDVDPDYVPSADHYSTWSVLETIGEMRSYYPQGYEQIKEDGYLGRTREWLVSEMESKTIKECQSFLADFDYETQQTDAFLFQSTCFYNAVHGLAGLAILDASSLAKRKFGHFTGQVLDAKPFILKNEFKTLYPKLDVHDYTLVPMLLRCLAAAFSSYDATGPSSGLGVLGDYKNSILLDLYEHIITTKLHYNPDDGKPDGLFCDRNLKKAANGENEKVDIYYTERVLESLIAYREHLRGMSDQDWLEGVEAPHISQKNPFQEKQKREIQLSTAQAKNLTLPALEIYASALKDRHGKCLSDCYLIIVQHFLRDLPVFIRLLIDLGCNPKNVVMIRKTYGYLGGDIAHDQLKEMGIRIVQLSERMSQQLALKKKVLSQAFGRCSKRKLRLLIIEDGGHIVPAMHKFQSKKDMRLCIGAVEQTTRGIVNDSEVDLCIPVVNVAKSALKTKWEGPEVAQTLVVNIREICGWNGIHLNVKGTEILVLGCGTVGALVAEKLEDMGFIVSAYDRSAKKREELRDRWKKRKIQVLDTIKDCTPYKIIFGTSGKQTISREKIMSCRHDVVLISGSSERYEIDLEAIEQMTKRPFDENIVISEEYPITTYELKTGKRIKVVCNAEPINFALTGGIPNPAIEPILMQMLWGAVSLASGETTIKNDFMKFPKKAEAEILKYYRPTQR